MQIIMQIIINNNENILISATAISHLKKPSHEYVNTKPQLFKKFSYNIYI